MLVYVLDINGHPLMPTKRFGKVRRMLSDGQAKVVQREPFTIRLLYDIENPVVQNLTLGVDTGSSKIGCAVVNEKQNVLYLSEVEIRNEITKKMDRRRSFRQNRRSRKTRYRKARFLNRKNSTKKDRYSPTLKSKFDSHVREIEFIKSILPIKNIVLEVGQFDTHKLKNPNVRGWGYQRGINYGFANSRAHALDRDNYTCQICGAKNTRLEVHHIIFRSQGGSDDLDNLITLCERCHNNLHNGKIVLKIKSKKKLLLKHASQMNVIRCMLLKHYPEAIETFGYVTKANREQSNLSKEHYNDAITIACGCVPEVKILSYLYKKKHVSKGDYQLTKGVRGEIKIPTGKIGGFKKFDKVSYFGKEYFIKGRMSSGYAFLMDVDSNKIDFSNMPKGYKTPKLLNLNRISARSSTLCMKVKIMPNIA